MQANISQLGGTTTLATQNRVLRNAYALLALTMIPTAIGAWLGMTTRIMPQGGLGFIIMLVGVVGGSFLVERNKTRMRGVAFLLGLTFFMGLMLSQALLRVSALSNGGMIITLVTGMTAVTFFGMAAVGTAYKGEMSGMARFVGIGFGVVIAAALANIFLQIPVLSLAVSSVVALGSAFFISYTINSVVKGGETNYISAALRLYLDVFNLFLSLLNIVSALMGNRD